jgi:hypothetical protein
MGRGLLFNFSTCLGTFPKRNQEDQNNPGKDFHGGPSYSRKWGKGDAREKKKA